MLQKLYDERGKIIKAQADLNDLCITEARVFSAEEMQEDARLDAEYIRLSESIDRGERDKKRKDEEVRLAGAAAPAQPPAPLTPPEPGKPSESRAQAHARHFNQYLRDGIPTPELRASTDPQSLTVADGGYLVPDEWLKVIITALEETNVMRNLATVIRTSSGTLNIPTNSAHGVAAWVAENSAIAVAKETYSEVTMSAYKAARIITITSELLNDSMFNMAQILGAELGRSIGDLQETAFVAGDGSSKPSGIAEATVGAATGVTAASATAITADELIELFHSIATPYRKNATWLLLDATALLIRKLKDGTGQYLWQPGLQAGQPSMLLGRPVVTSGDMPTAATTNNSVIFGDIKRAYTIADRVGFTMKRLNELYAVTDLIGFQATARTDGKIVDASAVRALTMA